MRWRIDVKADDVVQLGGELRVVRQFELARPVRLQAVFAPDALHRTDADAAHLGHRSRSPMGRLARWLGQRPRCNVRRHLGRERRDARRTGLVAQQAANPVRHIALLPTPDRRLAGIGTSHDLCRAEALRRQQHDPCAPDVLLRAVPVRRDRRKLPTISRAHFHYDPCAHGADSHPHAPLGILNRTQASDFIHSYVRHFKLQARIFLACPPSCSAQPPLGKAGGTIMKRRLIML